MKSAESKGDNHQGSRTNRGRAPSPDRIRLPKLNNLMTIDYSYHIRAVDRFATLDLKSNYSEIQPWRTVLEFVMRATRHGAGGGRMQNVAIAPPSEKQLTLAKIIKSISRVGEWSVAQ
ncbi:unnamed protein product [Leptosia nina]|uniref:Uncharacterized protein n=1 Tax=Leptosia nina TaxID=320188 RepID=A0AAV1JVK4_9NEOP